jgi:hypothetical protein
MAFCPRPRGLTPAPGILGSVVSEDGPFLYLSGRGAVPHTLHVFDTQPAAR